jgi:hypothetical protein
MDTSGTPPFWTKAEGGDAARADSTDTTAYHTYAPEDDPRLYCDKCARCQVYGCTGITAVHHFIHIDELGYFTQSDEEFERGLSPRASNSKHSDRDSGV